MAKKQVTIPIFIPHQGCPHRCVFCNQWESSGERTIPDRKSIKERIELYLSKIPRSVERIEAAFFGGSFTGMQLDKQEEFLRTVYRFKRRGSIHSIRLSTRPDYIDEERLSLLNRFEVETVELGVQSFSENVLIKSNRGHTVEDTYNAIDLLKKEGFNFVIQLMPGLPEETSESAIISAATAASLKPSSVRIYPTVVLNRTRLAEMYFSKEYKPLSLEEAIEICKEMLIIFQKQRVPVIRIGLHPFSEEEAKNIIAGPYHPAFGFLVKSRFKRDMMVNKITESFMDSDTNLRNHLRLYIPENEKEEYIGHKRENIVYLKDRFNHLDIEFIINSNGFFLQKKGSQRKGRLSLKSCGG